MANIAKSKLVSEGWAGLPPIAKGVILIGVGVGAFLIIRKIVKMPKTLEENKEKRQEDRGWNKEFDQLNSGSSSKATMTKAQMLAYANSLHTAMDGYGTDEDGIIAIFDKMKNDADFAGVNAAYGVRDVWPGTGTGWFVGPYNGNLIGALASELSQSYRDKINSSLAKKKIKYRV